MIGEFLIIIQLCHFSEPWLPFAPGVFSGLSWKPTSCVRWMGYFFGENPNLKWMMNRVTPMTQDAAQSHMVIYI